MTRADGSVDFDIHWEYDGDLVVREVDDGPRKRVTTHTYDAAGNLLETTEAHLDGTLVNVRRLEVDGRGNPLRIVVDDGGDGTPDEITTMTYDCWR